MPLGSDLKQRLVLVLQKEGDEKIGQLKTLVNDLRGEFVKAGEALSDAFGRGEGSLLEFNRETANLQKHYNLVVGLLAQVSKDAAAAAMEEGKAQRERIDGWAAAGAEMDRYQAKLKAMQAASVAEQGENEAARRLKEESEAAQELAAYHAKLKQMAEQSAQARAQAEAQSAAALQSGQAQMSAYMQSMDDQKKADIEQMGRRARMKAQFERDVDEAIEMRKMEVGAEKRARIDAYAAAEEAAEKANAATKKQMGDAIRAAAERHARIDAFNEEEFKKNIARMDAENKASESLANQKALYQRLAAKDLNENQIKELKRLTESIVDVNKFTDESIQKFNLIGGGMSVAEQKSKSFAMGLMAVAHAAQDAQYGFGAVVNNIPQIAYAMADAIPAIEKFAVPIAAVSMIGGTLINIALPQIKKFAASVATEMGLISDPTRAVSVTTDTLKAKLEALNDKSYKVHMDYVQIEQAEKRMKELDANLKAWESMANARTSVQEESSKRFKDTVKEGGGDDAMRIAVTDALGKMGRLRLGTEAQQNMDAAMKELVELDRTLKSPDTSPGAYMLANARKDWLESSLPAMRQAVKKEIDTFVGRILGGAGRGDANNLQDVMDAFITHPESFRGQGMDMNKVAAGIMSALPQNVKDEQENAREAERQAARAKAEKKRENDLIDDLNQEGKANDAAMKPIMEGMQKRKDAITRQWVRDNEEDADRIARNIKNAPAVAARAQRAEAAKGRAAAAAERRQKAAFNRNMRDLDRENEERSLREFSQDFQNAGFDRGFANMGAKQVLGQIKGGKGEEQALMDVYRKLLETVSRQEKMMGQMGQATILLQQLEAKVQGVDAMLQRQNQMMGRAGNKRRTLLLPVGQGG